MHSRYFLGILQFGHSESWELSGEWLAGSLLWKHWSATKIADLESAGTEGTFCAEYMEEVLDVSAQRKIAGRSNKMCTAWCLYDKYGGSLDESQILCLQFQGGSNSLWESVRRRNDTAVCHNLLVLPGWFYEGIHFSVSFYYWNSVSQGNR